MPDFGCRNLVREYAAPPTKPEHGSRQGFVSNGSNRESDGHRRSEKARASLSSLLRSLVHDQRTRLLCSLSEIRSTPGSQERIQQELLLFLVDRRTTLRPPQTVAANAPLPIEWRILRAPHMRGQIACRALSVSLLLERATRTTVQTTSSYFPPVYSASIPRRMAR